MGVWALECFGEADETASFLLHRTLVTIRKHEGFKMRHTVVITKVLVGVFTLLGTLPVAADEPTMEKRYRDEAKFKKRFELERAADRASRDSQILRQQEIVHIVPKEPLMSQYLNSEPGRSEPGDNKKWMAQLAEEDKGLTVRQAMERRLARFEAALEEARKYRKNLPMNAPEGAKERVALEGRIDSKINYEAFKKATSRAVAEYEAFDHYKSRAQSAFQQALGDIYRVPGENRVFMNERSQSMAAFFKSYSTGYVDPLPDVEKSFQQISEIEHRLKRNAHGGTSRMSTVLSQQLATMESAEKSGVRVHVGNMHVPARTDMQYDQKIALKFQSALRSAKELRAKTGGTGPVAVFVTAATVFSSTAALAGEAEPASPEVSGEVAAEFSRDWARPQARRTSR